MMKKMLSLALTIAMAATLTACGGSKPEQTTTKAATETTKAGETTAAGTKDVAADVKKNY